MSEKASVEMIRSDFLDFLNYNICKAYSELHGKNAAVDFFRRVGEIGFNELKNMVSFSSSAPYDVLKTVADFLVDMGYESRIQLTKVTDSEVIIEAFGASVIRSSKRLIEEGASPSHFMTNLMFAALDEISNVRADIYDLELEQPSTGTNYAREKWIINRK